MAAKILAYGDAGATTGFERVISGVLSYLQKTERYEIVQYGLGWCGQPEFKYDYPVYPIRDGDFFGFSGMRQAIAKHEPDVVFIVQDLWNLTNYMAYKPPKVPAVCYFPVDTPNLKWSYAIALGAMAEPVVYTRFGAQEVAASVQDMLDMLIEAARESGMPDTEKRAVMHMPHPNGPKMEVRLDRLARFQNVSNINVVPHGLDQGIFKVLDKKETRRKWGVDEDAFVIGSVNTNQFRKRQDTLMRIFAIIANEIPNARLIMFCSNNDERGWDLPQIARYQGIFEKTYFVHEQVDRSLSEQELCELYNLMDIHVNTAGGEGWGLTSIEAAACGVVQAVPNWSATREIWGQSAIQLPVSDWRLEPKFLNTAHAILDVKESAARILTAARSPEVLENYRKRSLEVAAKQLDWDEVGKRFERIIVRAINRASKLPEPRDFRDILNERQERVLSELARAVYMENGVPKRV